MDVLLHTLQNLLFMIPINVGGRNISIYLMIAGVLIVSFIGLLAAYFSQKEKKPKKPPAEIKAQQDSISLNLEDVYQNFHQEKLPFFRGFLAEFGIKTGLIKAGPITKSFLQVMEIIKQNIREIDWRYRLPFFLVIGNDKSGKSHLLSNLKNARLRNYEKTESEFWTLTHDGVLFELPSAMMTQKTDTSWEFLASLLMYFRPKRPADGIILTIPCDVLLNKDFDHKAYAAKIMHRLIVLQEDLNFKLPVYIIITKSDLLKGFKDFCSEISAEAKEQVFGWSNPYTIDRAFCINWLDEAFEELNIELRKVALLLGSEKKISNSLKNALFINQHVLSIKNQLFDIVKIIFSSYQENADLVLRGIYFTGQQDIPQDIHDQVCIDALSTDSFEGNILLRGDRSGGVCFMNELFDRKIFQEFAIAHPLNINKFANTSNDFVKNSLISLSFFIVIIAWFWASSNVKETIDVQSTNLISINETLKKVADLQKEVKEDSDKIILTEETKKLIRMLSTVKYHNIFSYCMPQTYFTSLRKDIKNMLASVLDALIAKSLYFGLDIGAKNILKDIYIQSESTIAMDIFDVSTFKSFINLYEYINKLYQLEKMESDYDHMRRTSDRNYMNDLAQSLFKENFNILEDLKGKDVNSNKAPNFTLKVYEHHIQDNVFILFMKFFDELFGNKIQKIFEHVVDEINKLVLITRSPRSDFSSAELAKVYAKTQLMLDIMNNPHCSWMFEETFNPNKKYADLLLKMQTSPVLGKEFEGKIIEKSAQAFKDFQEKMKNFRTVFTGFILNKNLKKPSEEFEIFRKEIKKIIDQPFMVDIEKYPFSSTISHEKILFWDHKILNDICKLIDQYELFESAPAGYREQFWHAYKILAQKSLIPNLKSMLEIAKNYEEIPVTSNQETVEELLIEQANNLKDSMKMLLKIIKFLNGKKEINISEIKLDKFIANQASFILEMLDSIFEKNRFYMGSDLLFNGWNGEGAPLFANMGTTESLKKYLSTERSKIIYLASKIAEPVISVISLKGISEAVESKILFNKWNGIVEQCNDFSRNKPGNYILDLEKFLLEDLEKFTINNVLDSKALQNNMSMRDNYFLDIKAGVSKSLIERTELLSYDLAMNAYNELAEFFNLNLAHKFPFGESGKEEATSEAIEGLVNLLEAQKVDVFNVLNGVKNKKNIPMQVLTFLEQMKKLIPFLKNWILHSKTSDEKGAIFSFKLDKRPTPKLELLAASIVDRLCVINNVEIEDENNILFYNGDSVSMQFNFAKISDDEILIPDNDESLTFEDDVISFNYFGNWAFFRVIAKHKQYFKDVNKIKLLFKIPIVRKATGLSTNVKLFMHLIPMTKNVSGAWEEFEFPEFPQEALSMNSNENTDKKRIISTQIPTVKNQEDQKLDDEINDRVKLKVDKTADQEGDEEEDEEDEDNDDITSYTEANDAQQMAAAQDVAASQAAAYQAAVNNAYAANQAAVAQQMVPQVAEQGGEVEVPETDDQFETALNNQL